MARVTPAEWKRRASVTEAEKADLLREAARELVERASDDPEFIGWLRDYMARRRDQDVELEAAARRERDIG